MRKILVTLPVTASKLETALHNACDSGHWEDEVQIVLVKDVTSYQNIYRLELVTKEG